MVLRRVKWKKWAAAAVLALCLAGVCFLAVPMRQELKERGQSVDFYEQLEEQYFSEAVTQAESAESDEAYPQWLWKLHEEWEDMTGWIYLEDSKINYPVVQGRDNDYYLHHLADGTENSAGSVMMDVRCDPEWKDSMTILYGHHMKNGTMFGELEKYKDAAYWESHKTLHLYTRAGSFQVDILAACEVDGNQFFYTPEFADAAEREAMIERLRASSSFQSNIQTEPEDYLVLLSTCAYTYEDARFVVLGRYQMEK